MTGAQPIRSERLEELRAEVRHHRERYELYRAKMYGPRPTTMTRLRELEQAHESALARLRWAEGGSDPREGVGTPPVRG